MPNSPATKRAKSSTPSTPSPRGRAPSPLLPSPKNQLSAAEAKALLAKNQRLAELRVLETDLYEFVWEAWHVLEPSEMRPGWHSKLICEELMGVTAGVTQNLLLNMPPRHGKSLLVSVFWPVWEWISRPAEQFLCVSYDLSLTQDLARRARDLIKSDWFQSRWGDRFVLSDDQDAKGHYTNDRLGARISITVRGGATGKGGTRIIVDDPHNTKTVESDAEREQVIYWWGNVIKSRKNNPDAAFVVVMQRCHEQDLTGHILDSEPGDWRHICLPARYELGTGASYDPRTIEGQPLWEEMYPTAALDAQQATMDPYAVAGQYQQRPVSRKGGMIDVSWFKLIDAMPEGVMVVRAWDLAATEAAGDDTAGGLVAEDEQGELYIDKVIDGQWAATEVEQILIQTALHDTSAIPIVLPQDPGQAGKAQTVNLATRVLRGFDVRFRRPTGSKSARAAPWISLARMGKVSLVKGPWVKKFLDQARMFPRGKHDDMIDFVSDGFAELVENGGGGGGLSREDYARFGSAAPSVSDGYERYLSQAKPRENKGGMRWKKR